MTRKGDPRSIPFYIFNMNIGRALTLPTLIYGPESDNDWGILDVLFLYQASLVQIITSLDVFYQEIFTRISPSFTLEMVDKKKYLNYIDKLNISKKDKKIRKDTNYAQHRLSEIFPEEAVLQNNKKIIAAMEILQLDPIGKYEDEWKRTFDRNEASSTIRIRHSAIHSGFDIDDSMASLLDRDFIINRIKDAILLASHLEVQIVNKFPPSKIPELYPK